MTEWRNVSLSLQARHFFGLSPSSDTAKQNLVYCRQFKEYSVLTPSYIKVALTLLCKRQAKLLKDHLTANTNLSSTRRQSKKLL